MTLDFQPRYSIWERAPSYATLGGGGTGAAASRLFNVTAVVRINQQPVLYTPPVSEVLQAGWGKVSMKQLHRSHREKSVCMNTCFYTGLEALFTSCFTWLQPPTTSIGEKSCSAYANLENTRRTLSNFPQAQRLEKPWLKRARANLTNSSPRRSRVIMKHGLGKHFSSHHVLTPTHLSCVSPDGHVKYVVMLAVILFLVDALSAFVYKHQVSETSAHWGILGGGCSAWREFLLLSVRVFSVFLPLHVDTTLAGSSRCFRSFWFCTEGTPRKTIMPSTSFKPSGYPPHAIHYLQRGTQSNCLAA